MMNCKYLNYTPGECWAKYPKMCMSQNEEGALMPSYYKCRVLVQQTALALHVYLQSQCLSLV